MPQSLEELRVGGPAPSENGDRPRSALVRPRIEREIDVDDYPGYFARVWLNPPDSLFAEVTAGDEGRAQAALNQIVLGHNGWPDEQGYELPQPPDPGFWEGLGQHLANRLMGHLLMERIAAPKLQVLMSARSGSGSGPRTRPA
jgi:hypothetical protein